MLTLPLPVVVALALAYTAARVWFGGDRARWHPMLVMLVVSVAAQSLLVACVQYYGVTWLRGLQPVTASMLPPLAWCAFVAVQVRPLRVRDAWHAAAPLLVLLGVLFWRDALDLLVIGPFVGYGVALLIALRPGVAELPLARLASGNAPRWLWRTVAVSLLVSAAGDGLIYWNQLTQWGEWRLLLISAMSSLMLLALGAIGLSPEWRSVNSDPAGQAAGNTPWTAQWEESNTPNAGNRRPGLADPAGGLHARIEALAESRSDAGGPGPQTGGAGQDAVGGGEPGAWRKRGPLRQPFSH